MQTDLEVLKAMRKMYSNPLSRFEWWRNRQNKTVNTFFPWGLCPALHVTLTGSMAAMKTFEQDRQYYRIRELLRRNAPLFGGNVTRSFWWESGITKPRKKLLNYLIKKISRGQIITGDGSTLSEQRPAATLGSPKRLNPYC